MTLIRRLTIIEVWIDDNVEIPLRLAESYMVKPRPEKLLRELFAKV